MWINLSFSNFFLKSMILLLIRLNTSFICSKKKSTCTHCIVLSNLCDMFKLDHYLDFNRGDTSSLLYSFMLWSNRSLHILLFCRTFVILVVNKFLLLTFLFLFNMHKTNYFSLSLTQFNIFIMVEYKVHDSKKRIKILFYEEPFGPQKHSSHVKN